MTKQYTCIDVAGFLGLREGPANSWTVELRMSERKKETEYCDKVIDILKSSEIQKLFSGSEIIKITSQNLLFVIETMPPIKCIDIQFIYCVSMQARKCIMPDAETIIFSRIIKMEDIKIIFENLHATTKYISFRILPEDYNDEIDFSNLPPTVEGITFFLGSATVRHIINESRINRITKQIFSKNIFPTDFYIKIEMSPTI